MATTKIDRSGVTYPDGSVKTTKGSSIAAGTYDGDNNDNRVILVGFLPKLVIISLGANSWIITHNTPTYNTHHSAILPYHIACVYTQLSGGGNGFRIATTSDGSNTTGKTYSYVAIG